MSSLEFWRLGLWHSSPFQGVVEGGKEREERRQGYFCSFFNDKEMSVGWPGSYRVGSGLQQRGAVHNSCHRTESEGTTHGAQGAPGGFSLEMGSSGAAEHLLQAAGEKHGASPNN